MKWWRNSRVPDFSVMRRVLFSGALAVLNCFAISAAPAQDSSNALESARTSSATWASPEFLAAWSSPPAGQTCVCRRYRGAAKIFGIQPQAIQGWFDNGKLTSITIIFLDSGAWFGYVPDAE